MYEEILDNILERQEIANMSIIDVLTIYIVVIEELEAKK